jgi:hypothetical protein
LLLTQTSFFTNAQLNKGVWLVGGHGKYFSYKGTYLNQSISFDSEYLGLSVSPNGGYFIADRLALGLRSSFIGPKVKLSPRVEEPQILSDLQQGHSSGTTS